LDVHWSESAKVPRTLGTCNKLTRQGAHVCGEVVQIKKLPTIAGQELDWDSTQLRVEWE